MFRESDGNSKVNQYRGYHPADVNHHLMVEHYVIPSSFGLFYQFRYRTQNDLTANQISQQGHTNNQQQNDKVVHLIRQSLIHSCRKQCMVHFLNHYISHLLCSAIGQLNCHGINYFFYFFHK